jgi:AraC family transcriptional regulator
MMPAPEFSLDETHSFIEAENFDISLTSVGLGWRRAFMSVQREGPYHMHFGPSRDVLINVVTSPKVKATITLDGKAYPIEGGPGTITIIPAYKSFDLDLETSVTTVHLYIRKRLLDKVIAAMFPQGGKNVDVRFCAAAYDPVLEQLCMAVRDGLQDASRPNALYVDHMLQGIAAFLVKNYSTAYANSPDNAAMLSEKQVKRTREIVESRLAQKITLADIAAEFGLSADHFGRLFKQATGVTLYQFIIRCRVERARTLLIDTPTPISDIAAECGFADQVHLTRAFGRIVGVTPAAYRRLHRGT